MPKKYPPREKKIKLIYACICGHRLSDHDIYALSLFEKCKICKCWHYRPDKQNVVGKYTE